MQSVAVNSSDFRNCFCMEKLSQIQRYRNCADVGETHVPARTVEGLVSCFAKG